MAAYTAGPQPNVQFQPGAQQPQAYMQPQMQMQPPPGAVMPGMEGLLHARQLIVKQKKEMAEVFLGWERNNRYEIYNEQNQLIYFAAEDTSEMSLCFFGNDRPFTIRIFDGYRRQVAVLSANVDCCTQQVVVQVPEGNVVAMVEKEFAFMTPSFYVRNNANAVVFKVKSPMSAAFGSFGNVKFDVLSADQQTVIGQISKHFKGFFREMFTDADTFSITVPPDMDATWKAVLLALLFLIDFTFYEKDNRR